MSIVGSIETLWVRTGQQTFPMSLWLIDFFNNTIVIVTEHRKTKARKWERISKNIDENLKKDGGPFGKKDEEKVQKYEHIHKHTFENSIQEKPIEVKQESSTSEKVKKHSFPFTIPSGTTWENIYIQFKNREAVTITTSGHTHDTSFADMGFADGRNGKPNVQWYLMLLFAKNGGRLTAGNPDARTKYKKQKQNLAKELKEYFGIEYDPFKPYGKSDGYQIKINLAPPTRVEEVEEEESVSEEIDEMFRNLS